MAPTPKPKRAVGYVRISVDRDDETSTTTQEERIRGYCTAHDLDVVDIVIEQGRSAYKSSRSSRPGFRKVMSLVSSGAADVVVVWKLDRGARDTRDTLALVDELAEYGAQFASVTEQFDTSTASGRMMLTMLSALAEMESAIKSERVKVWQDHRRANGATPTGPRPLGYRRERNRLIVDDDEAEVIRQAAARVLAGNSLRSILRDLEAAGVVGTGGKPLTRRTLRAILLGPTVAALRETQPGVFLASDAWEPILDRKTWDDLREVLNDPARRTTPGSARRWLLSGIVRCGEDDAAMYARPHVTGTRYACPKCSLSIAAERTDEVVETLLLAALDPKAWQALRRGRPATEDTSAYEQAIAELMERFVAGDIDGVEMGNLAEALRRQQEAVSAPPVALPDVPDLGKAWPKLGLEQRRLVLSAMTESLTIKPWTPGSYRFDETRIVWVPVA